MAEPARVLFVHPHGHPEEDVLPYGLVGLVNRLPLPTAGLFPHEITIDLLRGASVLLMDVHWIHALAGARSIARAVRNAAPSLPIVVGGYTATVFAAALVEDRVADYVIVGDAEGPLPALVRCLAEGKDPSHVLNLVARGFSTPRSYVLTSEDFDGADYLTLDWFPTLWARLARAHAARPVLSKHPVIPTYKGCAPGSAAQTSYCGGCYGQPRVQRRLFGRNLVARSVGRIREDLGRLSSDPSVARACLFDDPIAVLGEAFVGELFSEEYDLDLYMEPHRFFSTDLLRRMAGSVRRLELRFYHEDLGARVAAGDAEATAFLLVAKDLGVSVSLCLFAPAAPGLDAAAEALGLQVVQNTAETLALPDPMGDPDLAAASYPQFMAYSAAFGVLELITRTAPAYLDAIAVQLGLVDDPEGHIERRLPAAARNGRCLLDLNPVFRQVMAGANPLRLTFWAAPYVSGAPSDRPTLAKTPLSRVLASPVRLDAVEIAIAGESRLEVCLDVHCLRTGVAAGLAVNFVSDRPGGMAGLPYDALWKLCLPLDDPRLLRAGEAARFRITVGTQATPPITPAVRLESPG